MKRSIAFGTLALLAGSLMAADSPKDEVNAAAKKLADKGNYSWKTTVDLGAASQAGPQSSEGKTDKGLTWLGVTFNDNTSEGVMKTTNNFAVKTDSGWQSASEVTAAGGGGGGGGGFNPGIIIARQLQTLKVPAADVQDLVAKSKEIKKDADGFSADLTEDGAKAYLSMRGRRGGGGGGGGGQPPVIADAKGTVKFWVKDGAITKYQTKVTGKREIQGEMRDVERTTTIELKDVGTTKLEVPEDAKKKLS